MKNIVLSTRNIDDFISDVANEVVKKIAIWNVKQQSAEQHDELLTVEQAAEFLSLSVATVYSKVSKSELPACKQSKRLYFSRLDLINHIKQGRKKTDYELKQDAENYCNTKGGAR